MAAMTGAGMGRGCCLQQSWSMFAGPGSQLLGTVLRAHACGPEMDPRACDGQTTVCPLWLLGGAVIPGRADPESKCKLSAHFWIPGSRFQRAPE